MPSIRGTSARVMAFVTANPGCARSQILAALGLGKSDAIPTYCVKRGLIFVAGARGAQRYYPTQAQASAVDAAVRAADAARKREQAVKQQRLDNLRRRMRRAQAGARTINTRPGLCVPLDGAVILPNVRMTIAQTPPPRWQPVGPPPSVIDSSQARPWAQAAYGGGR